MAEPRRDYGLIGLIAAFVVLAAAVGGMLLLFQAQQRAQALVLHTLEVESRLAKVFSLVQDAESAQRGFIVSRDPAHLGRYEQAREALPDELAALTQAVSDNPEQRERAVELTRLVDQRLDRLAYVLGLARDGQGDGAREAVRTGVGKQLMDRTRELVGRMHAEEARLLAERGQDAQDRARLFGIWLVVAALLVALLAVLVTRDARARARDAAAARDEAEAANRRLKEEAATREAAEAQVRQMHKMESIGQLTGGIAHDFNNMLAVVIGSLDMAKRRLAQDPARAEASIDAAMQGAERAAQLTQRLLAFARRQPLAPSAIDVNRLVGGMSELLRRTIGETVRLETVLAGGLWPAFVDSGQLENALVNLCVNGRDAMDGAGRLTIETANAHLDDEYARVHDEVAAGQYVMISVTDTGCGMPADVAERAFDPFYTTKEVGKGTGLGLSQVYGFVKQSGGHVKIYSEIGVGTVVKLYLPRHFGEGAASAPAGPAAHLPQAAPGEVVLVVEDEERVRELSVDALRELGYTVIDAPDAERALDLLRGDQRVDLLFTDIVMPGMDGRRLADAARAARPGLCVLYTTGYTRNAIVHNGVLDHDVQFLAKPFTVTQLAAKVRSVLDSAG
ncbi:CHASE3 domain-containing protein [Sphingomonas canadensis]|uniref:histidine kinase n=1 Tax=Sphingomonas canadensis TaxID=1219257 RepID=A0ABW3H403_9SPHN|nr:CHASE3 domain-containing protein [Sphingomonas canadensis]MCW3835951.1 CHASE3 domain-containing protein [Sphingomonas canadensis]